MKPEKIPETFIAQAVMLHLQGWGWDCYPEAGMSSASGRADIAATRGPVLWVVECKTGFTLALLDQAMAWLGKANLVSVAIPERRYSQTAMTFLGEKGIGVLEYRSSYSREPDPRDVRERLKPRFFRDRPGVFDVPKQNRLSLHPDMKRAIPGSKDGGYSTPWRRTMEAAENHVRHNPGCTVKELAAAIDHHYSTAGSAHGSLLHWLPLKTRVRVDSSRVPHRLYLNQDET